MSERAGGVSVGQYELREVIGRGGMAVVYRARQPRADRDVAIKVIPPPHARSAAAVQRFENEARAAARLQHPHILPVYDVGSDHGEPFLVMAYLPGGTLRQRITRSVLQAESAPEDESQIAGVPLDEVICLTYEIASALDYAHANGIIHRDVKPGNVLLDAQGHAYLADFGIAQLSAAEPPRRGYTPGTYAYMAPEVAAGQPATPASDIYSLGVMIYEMLTTRRPFDVHDRAAVLAAHQFGTIPDLRVLRPDVPPGVKVVVVQALSPEPASRPAHAGALALALARSAGMARLACAPEMNRVPMPEPPPLPDQMQTAPPEEELTPHTPAPAEEESPAVEAPPPAAPVIPAPRASGGPSAGAAVAPSTPTQAAEKTGPRPEVRPAPTLRDRIAGCLMLLNWILALLALLGLILLFTLVLTQGKQPESYLPEPEWIVSLWINHPPISPLG